MLDTIKGFFYKVPKPIDRTRAFKATPMVRPDVTTEMLPEGERVVLVPRAPLIKGWFARFLPREMPPSRYIIDELGEELWSDLDGEHTVADLIESFRQRKKVHRREAEASVTGWLKMLMERNIIVMAVPDDGRGATEEDGKE